jgi:cytochrome c556
MELAMLDEEEYAEAARLYNKLFSNIAEREQNKKALLDYYNNLTGEYETEVNAIMHHRIAQYGPPCENCGKPYRTPKASFCAACGHKRPGFAAGAA